MKIIRHAAYARAGLMGNPSDGYGGRSLSFTFTNFRSTVVLYEWDRVEIVWSQQDKGSFATVDELIADVELNGYYGGVRLVKATIKLFVEYCRAQSIVLHDQPFSVRYDTDVPRGVGLSGSSAIVTATLRCLMEFYGVQIPQRVQPSLVRSVENDELNIACGLQDRVVQVYGGLVAMDFGPQAMEVISGFECGLYEHVDAALLPPLYIAYDLQAAKISSTVHTPLRVRVQQEPRLREILMEIAGLVPQACDALRAHDHERLHALINRNFDLRTQLYTIPERQLAMIRTARSTGASAKFAGSGGAIVGSYRDEAMYEDLRRALTQAGDWWIVKPVLGPEH